MFAKICAFIRQTVFSLFANNSKKNSRSIFNEWHSFAVNVYMSIISLISRHYLTSPNVRWRFFTIKAIRLLPDLYLCHHLFTIQSIYPSVFRSAVRLFACIKLNRRNTRNATLDFIQLYMHIVQFATS